LNIGKTKTKNGYEHLKAFVNTEINAESPVQ